MAGVKTKASFVSLKKVLRKPQSSISKFKCFCWSKIDIHDYYIQNVQDGTEIRECKKKKISVYHFKQFISVNVKKILRNSQAQFREKLRNLRLKQMIVFLLKKRVFPVKLVGLVAVILNILFLFVLSYPRSIQI